jgi:predicted transcriptional regulator
MALTIELSATVEAQLQGLAERQGRDVRTLVEDAVRQYVEAAAITDLDGREVAETQAAVAGELPPLPEWQDGGR